jgi:hypothetical protein
MPIPTINELWKDIASKAVLEAASEDQRKDCKRFFFAGAHTMYTLLVDEIAKLSEEDGEKAMMSIEKQFQGFTEALKMGEA